MKVKIGTIWYDPNDIPIMVVLSESDKQNIKNMLPEATKYCAYPSHYDQHAIREWMECNREDTNYETG